MDVDREANMLIEKSFQDYYQEIGQEVAENNSRFDTRSNPKYSIGV